MQLGSAVAANTIRRCQAVGHRNPSYILLECKIIRIGRCIFAMPKPKPKQGGKWLCSSHEELCQQNPPALHK